MVTNKRKWAVGSDEWTRDAAPDRLSEPALGHVAGPDRGHLLETTGIFWESVDLTDIQPSGRDRARARLRAALPELIWNDAALEGNNFTLPEVRTLLDGVTVGGKKLEDEQQILALSEAYDELDRRVANGEFALDYDTMCCLHRIVARHESLDPGMFRGEGAVTGGGTVRLANGGVIDGFDHGPRGELLRQRLADMLAHLHAIEDPRERALVFFAAATRRPVLLRRQQANRATDDDR